MIKILFFSIRFPPDVAPDVACWAQGPHFAGAADQPDGLIFARQPAHRAGDRSITPGGQAHHRRHRRSHLKDPARQRRLLCIACLCAWQDLPSSSLSSLCSFYSFTVIQCVLLDFPNSQLAPSATNPFYGPRLDSHREAYSIQYATCTRSAATGRQPIAQRPIGARYEASPWRLGLRLVLGTWVSMLLKQRILRDAGREFVPWDPLAGLPAWPG